MRVQVLIISEIYPEMCLWLALTLGLFSVLPVKLTLPTALLPSAGKKCVHHNDPTYADFSSSSLAEGGLPFAYRRL